MTISETATRPAHISDAVFYDFDMFGDSGMVADPQRRMMQLLEEAPEVFWTPHNGGLWMILGFEANFEAVHDPAMFSNNSPQMLQAGNQNGSIVVNGRRVPNPYPICLDGEMHKTYRAPLQRVFSPKAVAALRDNIRALANDVLDKVVARGHCDAVPDIAEPLHITVFLALLGLPLERLSEFREIIKKFKAPYKHHLEMIDRLCMVVDAMRDVILARRERPENDLISMLWQTEIDGRPMTYDDMENYAVILFTAGLDTVVNGMAFGIRHLANDLALQERLRAEPQLIAEATEELLRRYTFVMPPRIVARDATFRGCTMKRGDRVMLLLPAANLDEQAFPDPEQYLLDREKKAHIAFGLGAHRCVGSHLARIELQELYDVMLARLPQFRAAPDKPAQFHPGHVVGIHSLPIVWNVG